MRKLWRLPTSIIDRRLLIVPDSKCYQQSASSAILLWQLRIPLGIKRDFSSSISGCADKGLITRAIDIFGGHPHAISITAGRIP